MTTTFDIAADLPKKFFAMKKAADVELQFKPSLGEHERLELGLTEHQRILYKGGLKKLQDAANETNGRKRAHPITNHEFDGALQELVLGTGSTYVG